MRYRKLTSTGDYSFGHSMDDFYIDVPEAVGQAVETRLWLWLGTWYLDIADGTPYMQGILGMKSQTEADVTIQDRANGTQGFVDYQDYESSTDPDTRGMTVSFAIDTIYGPTAVTIQNYGNY